MNPPRLYSDLSWLWPYWGDPATEYARFAEAVEKRGADFYGPKAFALGRRLAAPN